MSLIGWWRREELIGLRWASGQPLPFQQLSSFLTALQRADKKKSCWMGLPRFFERSLVPRSVWLLSLPRLFHSLIHKSIHFTIRFIPQSSLHSQTKRPTHQSLSFLSINSPFDSWIDEEMRDCGPIIQQPTYVNKSKTIQQFHSFDLLTCPNAV